MSEENRPEYVTQHELAKFFNAPVKDLPRITERYREEAKRIILARRRKDNDEAAGQTRS